VVGVPILGLYLETDDNLCSRTNGELKFNVIGESQ